MVQYQRFFYKNSNHSEEMNTFKLYKIALCLTLLAVLGILSPSHLSAQGTLQFNQVMVGTVQGNTIATGAETNIGTITVPANKVWKVESVSYLYLSGVNWTPLFGSTDYARFGDITVAMNFASGSSSVHFPIWLKEGTYNVYAKKQNQTGGYQVKVAYSAIEFNVVP